MKMAGIGDLTAREHEVFKLIVSGKQNKEIADAIGFSFRTAQFHVTNILHKLKCGTRYEVQAKYRPPRFEETLVLADLVGRVTALENKVKELEAGA